MASTDIDAFIAVGTLAPGSRVDLAKSGVGVARARPARPSPTSASIDAFKTTLLAAKSIGYSTGPSGIYVIGLFERLGIADRSSQAQQTPTGAFVGSIVANGEVEIGFQQVSELRLPGIDLVGPLPARSSRPRFSRAASPPRRSAGSRAIAGQVPQHAAGCAPLRSDSVGTNRD